MTDITRWDRIRASLGFGYTKKTEEAMRLEAEMFIENLRQQAAERVAAIKAEEAAKAKPKAKAKPPVIDGINKKAAANKKPVAKTATKKDAIKKDLADTPVAKKKPATKKPSK